MAIYTEYGRYLKAKRFKEMADRTGVYMVLGLGNPFWNGGQVIPIAPYSASAITSEPNNQFNDDVDHIHQYLGDKSGLTLTDSFTNVNSLPYKCRDIIPPFPAIWDGENETIFDSVTQSNFQNYYITKTGEQYNLHRSSTTTTPIDLPADEDENSIIRQYFAEMYLRGLAITNSSSIGSKNPVGLLGAVRCDVSLVRDIGLEENNLYVGGVNQFWYGDRYWEIVRSEDDVLSHKGDDGVVNYPHHLLFTMILNPKALCSDYEIDKCIVPMHIALYLKKDGVTLNKSSYKVGEATFNFGQYSSSELSGFSGDVLNFAPKYSSSDPEPGFEFLLNDYIKGSPRKDHMVDRIGYVVGF